MPRASLIASFHRYRLKRYLFFCYYVHMIILKLFLHVLFYWLLPAASDVKPLDALQTAFSKHASTTRFSFHRAAVSIDPNAHWWRV